MKQLKYFFQEKKYFNGFIFWKGLNVGTFPTLEMHNIQTVPTFKMHNIGISPTFQMQNIGTVHTFRLHNIGNVPMFEMHNVDTLDTHIFNVFTTKIQLF